MFKALLLFFVTAWSMPSFALQAACSVIKIDLRSDEETPIFDYEVFTSDYKPRVVGRYSFYMENTLSDEWSMFSVTYSVPGQIPLILMRSEVTATGAAQFSFKCKEEEAIYFITCQGIDTI